MIKIYDRTQQYQKIELIRQEMEARKIELNSTLTLLLLSIYAKRKKMEQLEELFERATELNILTEKIYNTVMSAYARDGNTVKLSELFTRMKKHFLRPDPTTMRILRYGKEQRRLQQTQTA